MKKRTRPLPPMRPVLQPHEVALVYRKQEAPGCFSPVLLTTDGMRAMLEAKTVEAKAAINAQIQEQTASLSGNEYDVRVRELKAAA